MKGNHRMAFLASVFFLGILLSVTIYLIPDSLTVSASENDAPALSFNLAFRKDGGIGALVKYVDYKVFRHVDDETMIIGDEEWLFETVREDNGYEYLRDYVGGCAYTEEERLQIAQTVALRRQACEERGAEYLLVVIPNSMTVESDRLPAYLGSQSGNTRLGGLMALLEERREIAVLDLRQVMADSAEGEPLFNNTEDSVNAYGAFAVYDAILNEIFEADSSLTEHRLHRDEIRFYTHYTEGKSVARKAGIEHLVANRTVSLSENMADFYRMTEVTEHCVTTDMMEGMGDGRRVVIECSNEWDKIQLMPFFSNTFSTVVYENSIGDGVSALDYHNGSVLIQVIHESELDLLLQ